MTLNLDRRITLSPHAALKKRAEGEILVLPERAIRLKGSAGQILRLCDGVRTGQDVISAMQTLYPHDPQMNEQVVAFLNEMWSLGGLTRP